MAPLREAGRDERILILAPLGRDAALARDALHGAGLTAHICRELPAITRELTDGAGGLLISEEAIPPGRLPILVHALENEPSWSDLPIVVLLTVPSRDRPPPIRHFEPLRNVTMLNRPVRIAELVSAVSAALRARRRQYEIRDLMLELQRALQARDELIASVSHELRTPLNVILGWAATLQRRAADPTRAREAVTILERNARVLWQLVEDLIDVSRIASGRVQLRMGPVDVGAAVRSSIETLRPSARAKHVAMRCEVDPDLPRVRGDDVRLQQVVWNLIWNALKFTPAGGRVDVTVRGGKDGVELVIADTGIGIDPDFLPHVFEPFRQGTAAASDPTRGLGLGLAIVRQLVELHGGRIDAASEGVGLGARFRVTLPAADGDEAASGLPESRSTASL